ncbi:hypothetical protein CHRY9390_02593 [Chryseobacterium aquaeductus]|uniref:Uncharacterized protein n=1 Tax=Chryseobacterium aquaeductus TaxID=2675056 RepID=A0A9N8MHI2_9FLAO|nr:hypothetical protein [Chryseobacterium aquaeductus]CAA7331876.1 hypothetical protein CHRY9390_02593 [Chryseobacterium potabilaquae]CAD7812995.1 hypothetical protein CHRY9390_02593 [Chryseobacterium aquaeductus]
MKTLHRRLLFISILIFNIGCAQNYNWKKLNDGLYIADISKSKNNIVSENDTLSVEMYMFQPNDEIDFIKPINGRPSKFRAKYSNLPKMFDYGKKLNLKRNSEYLIKKFNAKKIPNYNFRLNKISEEKMKEIVNSINKQYGVEFTEIISNKDENGKTIISSLMIKPNNEIDVEKIKKEFQNYISEINILNPNLLIYVYKIKT